MNLPSWLLWGSAATVLLATLLEATQELRITRINLPYILGTVITPHRDRARVVGFGLHLVLGLIFSLVYVAIFESLDRTGALLGAALGLAHAAFVLLVGMRLLPGVHPRMASEQQGPTARRQLEPPGPLALHYGLGTPLSMLLCHAVFGALLGAFYRLA